LPRSRRFSTPQGWPAEILHHARQPVGPKRDRDSIDADIYPLDQQLDDARLLGREEFVPRGIKVQEGVPDLVLADGWILFPSRFHVATMISGVPKVARRLGLSEAGLQ